MFKRDGIGPMLEKASLILREGHTLIPQNFLDLEISAYIKINLVL